MKHFSIWGMVVQSFERNDLIKDFFIILKKKYFDRDKAIEKPLAFFFLKMDILI